MHVVPSGGVLQQMNHADRIGGLPAVLEPGVRSQLANRVIQRQESLGSQQKDRERGNTLPYGSNVEERLPCDLAAAGYIRLANAGNPLRPVTAYDGDRYAR